MTCHFFLVLDLGDDVVHVMHIRLELVLESNPMAATFTNNKGMYVRPSIKVCEEPIYNSGDEVNSQHRDRPRWGHS
jgi:hypothetical protein